MKKMIFKFFYAYFDPALGLRVRLFHVLAIAGIVISISSGIMAVASNSGPIHTVVNFIMAAFAYILLIFSHRTGRYQVCYFITIIVVFMILFPIQFFTAGGYNSGMPSFFVFAVAFTIFMLEGKKAILLSCVELLLYVAICLIAYFYPETVNPFAEEAEEMIDIIFGFTVVSIVLGISMFFHFRLYNEQQKKLNEQNIILAQSNRAKTEFLSNTSHEMRTPLTVISVNVQTVKNLLEDLSINDPAAEELLKNSQSEIMRLARMVGGMLSLASMSENTDKTVVDLTALLQSIADMLRLNIQRTGNRLTVNIEPNMKVFGSADLLAQVVTNLIQNAGAHTMNGNISLSASKKGSEIHITVRDTGTGIAPELLPRIFERGVSIGGTGFGLYLCKTVVESHGGKIWIESEPGKGTTVIFTLPFFEGQFGGNII
jgi:signal transduction histidine kinase